MILGVASSIPVVAGVASSDRHHTVVAGCPFCGKPHRHGGWGAASPAGAVNGGRYSHCDAMKLYVIAEVPGTTWERISADGERFRYGANVNEGATERLQSWLDRFIRQYETIWDGPGRRSRPVKSDHPTTLGGQRLMGFEMPNHWPYAYFTQGPVSPGAQWDGLGPVVPPGRRCALYHHFDAAGALLYVGISEIVVDRGKQHSVTAEWVRFVATTTAKWYPNRAEAEAAERAAIRNERPLFNRQHNDWPGRDATRSAYLEAHRMAASNRQTRTLIATTA